jgi:hypothetical protein
VVLDNDFDGTADTQLEDTDLDRRYDTVSSDLDEDGEVDSVTEVDGADPYAKV